MHFLALSTALCYVGVGGIMCSRVLIKVKLLLTWSKPANSSPLKSLKISLVSLVGGVKAVGKSLNCLSKFSAFRGLVWKNASKVGRRKYYVVSRVHNE